VSQALFEAIREAASSATWSRGVELVRAQAVHGESQTEEEMVLHVSTRGGLISPTVTLSPQDEDWDCDCGTSEDACEHVCAAVIAWRRASSEGGGMPGSEQPAGRIGYRLSREGGGLAIERVVVTGEREETLIPTLTAIASGRVAGPRFVATQDDLAVEQTLGAKRRGRIPRGILTTLTQRLAPCPDVTLDGEPVRSSALVAGWVGVLEDENTGFRLRVRRDERVHETFDGILALCEGTLCPLSANPLTGREREDLARGGQRFEASDVARLVTEVLPDLEKRVTVKIRTRRLPKAVSEPPRLRVDVARQGEALEVFPTLVYGDPPLARVDAGKLVPLGAGPVPLRDEAAERALTRRMQKELELAPGRRASFTGEQALRVAERLRRFHGAVVGDALEGFSQSPALEAHFSAADDTFEIAFDSPGEEGPRAADPARVLRAWRAGESLVPLAGGGFAPLPHDWLARFGDRVADLLAARAEAGRLPRALLPELADLCEELDEPPPPSLEGLRALLGSDGRIPDALLPGDLTATLRGYQHTGIGWLQALRDAGLGALLADDMGLGKTLQALCAVRGRTLVVAPTSVLPNWAAEAQRFRPSLSVCVYHGPGRALAPEADLTLTTYAILRLDADALAGTDWDTVVLDEAQMIKNPDSQVARAAYRLKSDFALALTGTPVENRLEELWSQLHFTNRGLLGGRRDFEVGATPPPPSGCAHASVPSC
jgi:hypothetical protein